MPKTIWKFPLQITDSQHIAIPEGYDILHVAIQWDACCVWALVDPEMPIGKAEIRMYGTGHTILDDYGPYIGTVMLRGGSLVFHVFCQPCSGVVANAEYRPASAVPIRKD